MGCHYLDVVTTTCTVRNSLGFQMLQKKTQTKPGQESTS